jgi:hypothetical protein
MSATLIPAEKVIIKARECINGIKKCRDSSDQETLMDRTLEIEKSNRFWNKITFGLVKIISRVDSITEADGSLRANIWACYPDNITCYDLERRAIKLIALALENPSGNIEISGDDIFVIRWGQKNK